MGALTIRNLDDEVKGKLRIQAAEHGCSMEEEARRILRQALAVNTAAKGFGSRVHQKVLEEALGYDLPLPARTQPRPPPDFHEE